MKYNIGLDFGTTNSIIACLENDNLVAFKYGAPGQQEEYIPSFIAYDEDTIEIGTAARTTAAHHPNLESYGNFKMRLPLPESEYAKEFKGDRSPQTVTSDYLRELLISPENPYCFSREKGEIARLVVSVPEIWQRDIYNLGRERLQKLTQDLGLPLMQLVSEPVAAAAYYAWQTRQRSRQNQTAPFAGNLLVCDMGGGTFDVSLCRIYGENKVEVLYFDGQGDKGLDAAGVAFDRRCVQTAYTKKYGNPLEENSTDFQHLRRQFESIKIGSHAKITKKLTNYLKAPDAYAEQDLYIFAGGYAVNFREVAAAFDPINAGIQRVMQRVQAWLQQHNQHFDRLFLVGGFSQFLLVQTAIYSTLGIDANDPKIDRQFNITDSAYAISYGACLIANGLVNPHEKYAHTMGIVINREVKVNTLRGIQVDVEELEIPLIQGGLYLDKLKLPQFYAQDLVAWQEVFTVPLWVDPQSQGKRYRKTFTEPIKLPNYSQTAKYRVGMRVNSSQVAYLVIQEVDSREFIEYELGNILAKMFPGFILSENETDI